MGNTDSWQFIVTWLMTGAGGILLLLRFFGLWRFWRQNREIPYRRNVDISDLNTPPPDALRPTISELEGLGFQRLGEAQVEHIEKGPIRQVRVLVNAERTVFTEVIPSPMYPTCGFTTAFGDGAMTEVFYPEGESVDDADYVHHRNSVSIADAYRQQLEQVAAFSEAHGTPRSIRTMQDCLDVAALFRERYSRRLVGTVLRTRALIPLTTNLVVVILLAGLLKTWHRFGSLEPLFFGVMLVVAAIYFTWMRPRRRIPRQVARDKPPEE